MQRCCLFLLALFSVTATADGWDHLDYLHERYPVTAATARSLWEFAEVGYQETRISALPQRQKRMLR